uniref:Methylosome subunit pICln n=1 Tax=Sinocyclocheilus rhinocerous TaxID=307959 RepID=A0A673GIZ4_9TELE
MVVLKSLHPPSEGVRLQQADTTAVLDGKRLGSGTLFVAEAHLSWFDGSGMGFCLEYPSISLHAISRDLSAFPEEHLYVMVNAKLDVEPMFSAMCDCQALHPDPDDADTDDDDYEGEEYDVEEGQGQGDVPTFYTYEEGLSHLTAEGQATLDRLEGMLAQSVAQQYHMAGVRTDVPSAEFEDGSERE